MNNLMGVGVSRNDLNAVDYLRRSAELDYPPARLRLDIFMTPAPWCRKTPAKLRTGTGGGQTG
jgi:TPR repeat protein